MKFQKLRSQDPLLDRVQDNIGAAFDGVMPQVATYVTNILNQYFTTDGSPGWRWDTTEDITAQTTDGATWVPMKTIGVPLNTSVQFLATVIGTEVPPFTSPAVMTTVSARAAYKNDFGTGLLLLGSGFLWSATSGGTSLTRWTLNANQTVTFEVRGDAGYVINWKGSFGARWNP